MKLSIKCFVFVAVCLKSQLIFCEQNYLDGCNFVKGELRVWNGWPPYLRLHSQVEGLGVLDRGDWISGIGLTEGNSHPPIQFQTKLSNYLPNSLRGEFEICYLGIDASVPYYEKPIPLFEISGFRDVEVAHWDATRGTLIWDALNAAPDK